MTVYPVFRVVDDNGNENFWLVVKKLSKNGEVREVEGVRISIDGIGCLRESDTIAFANCRGIQRLKVTSGVTQRTTMKNAVEVLVVVEKVIKDNWFLAINDMLLPLYMINESQACGYVDSFTYWDTEFLDARYLKRADLVQHYYNLLHVRESLQHPLKSSTDDNGEKTIHCFFDRRMRNFLNQYAEDESLSLETSKSQPTEHKVVDERTMVALSMRIPVVNLYTFKLESFLVRLVGKDALWAPMNDGRSAFSGDLLSYNGAKYRVYVFDRQQSTLSIGIDSTVRMQLDTSLRMMNCHPQNVTIIDPFGSEPTLLSLTKASKIHLDDGTEMELQPYFMHPIRGVSRLVHTFQQPSSLTRDDQLENFDPNSDKTKFRFNKRAATSVTLVVCETVHSNDQFDMPPLEVKQLQETRIMTCFSGLVQVLEGGTLQPRNVRCRTILYSLTGTEEVPLKNSGASWVHGLLVLSTQWHDYQSWYIALQSLFETYKQRFSPMVKNDIYTYFRLTKVGDSINDLANALHKAVCSEFTHPSWTYEVINVDIK